MPNFVKIKSITPTTVEEIYTLESYPTHNYFANGVLNQNSGKDFISGVLALRTIYKLLCYADPRETFRRTSLGKISIAPGDKLSILNVAVNADQAKGVYFDKLCGLVKNAGDKAFNRFGFDFNRDVKANRIEFPKELEIISGHSRSESLEGRNLIMAILDEISAFKTESELKGNSRGQMSGQAIYDVLSTSIRTRFPVFGKLVMISYPRFKGDFLLTKYAEAEKLKLQYPEIGIYLSKGATWEINPTKSRSDKAIAEDYQKNPEKAAQFYECIAPDTEDPYFRLKEKIHRCYETQEVRNPFNPLGGYDVEFRAKNLPYTIHLDLAFSGDRAAFAMSHVEGSGDNRKFYTDLIRSYKAEPNKEIDLQLIEDEIKLLKQRGFNICMVSYDNISLSKFLTQRLEKAGFKTEYSSVDRGLSPYETFKEILYKEQFKTYYDEVFITELLGLTLVNGKKVDHLATGCFIGDTKISLCDGRNVKLIDLVSEFEKGKENYVYSFNHILNKIEPKLITNAFKTKTVDKVLQITLDNNETIECTLDHKFMLRDGAYIEAEKLNVGQSLMPLYTKYPIKGKLLDYRMYYEPMENMWHFEHRQFVETKVKGNVVRHKDYNKHNNSPINLVSMSKTDHTLLHNRTPSIDENKRRASSVRNWHLLNKNTPMYASRNAKVSATRKANSTGDKRKISQDIKRKLIKEYFNLNYDSLSYLEKQSYSSKLSYTLNPERREKVAEHSRNQHASGKMKNAKEALSLYNKNMIGKTRSIEDRLAMSKGRKLKNHKVLSVKVINKVIDVFDLTIKDNHNFALSAGVFVHNSKDLADAVVGSIFSLVALKISSSPRYFRGMF